MRRFIVGNLVLLTLLFAPAASFGQSWDGYCGTRGYQPNRYYGNENRYYDQRNSYEASRDYDLNYDRDSYGYSDRDSRGRSAAYVGGGAAAGAAIGAIIGHGKGAAIGAIAGATGGYLYKRHNDRR